MNQLFHKLGQVEPIEEEELAMFFNSISKLAPAEVAAVLGWLLGRHDGEDAAKAVAAVRRTTPLRHIAGTRESPTINIVGTGGGPSTFNISTATSFLLATAGVTVIKTGSTAWRSKSGFMEVAMALGCLNISTSWEQIEAVAKETGIAFVPPALYSPVLRVIADSLTPSIFRKVAIYINIIGPLLSPVSVDYRFIGASSEPRQSLLVKAATMLGDTPACVYTAENGLDEVSSVGKTSFVSIDNDSSQRAFTIDPGSLSLADVTIDDLAGLGPMAGARLLKCVLEGEGTRQQTEVIALNGATVLWQLGLYDSLSSAFDACMALISDGKPAKKIIALKEALKSV